MPKVYIPEGLVTYKQIETIKAIEGILSDWLKVELALVSLYLSYEYTFDMSSWIINQLSWQITFVADQPASIHQL